MKKLFLILICLPIIGFSQHRVSIEDLTDSNGKMNTDGKVVPSNGPSVIGVKYLGDLFTGIAYVETDNNQLVSEFNYKNGYLHGFKIWYESGKLRVDGQCIDIEMNEWNLKSWYENGNQHRNSHNLLVIKGNKFEKGSGTHFGTEWHENGQIKEESNYKDGNLEGLDTFWYENGQKKSETNWKGQERHGKSISWYKNGQKKSETNWKDGKRHGKSISWDENGQKESDDNYKDGELQ